METLSFINYIVAVTFMVCYCYQFFYIFVALMLKPKKMPDAPLHKYAVVISARNEEAVIGHLIESIKNQHYPTELIHVFVVADNCTDNTAAVAKDAGATVWERFNTQFVGKGYALEFLFQKIKEEYSFAAFDGYFIFDADNLLDENYVAEMNKTFGAGYRIVTSYRNSKNYGTNWISAGYSLWFLREAKYLNNARMMLNTSCAVSGTGFLVHHDIIERNDGWKHFLLTEDIEFTIDSVLHDERIGYCGTAILYDEQPVTFAQSWRQRMRWAKGYLQVFRNYGVKLLKGIVSKPSFACFDMTMAIMPAIILSVFSAMLNTVIGIMGILLMKSEITVFLWSLGETLLNMYLLFFGLGAITAITEWKQIHCKIWQKIVYCFTFPIFMFTYIPISLVALFKKVEWKPIKHNVSKKLEDIRI